MYIRSPFTLSLAVCSTEYGGREGLLGREGTEPAWHYEGEGQPHSAALGRPAAAATGTGTHAHTVLSGLVGLQDSSVCVCVCVCVCVHVCTCACVRACMRACVCRG